MVYTQPDITYVVGIFSRYMEKSTVIHLNSIKRICWYVKGIPHQGLVYTKEHGNYILLGFSYSELAGSVDDRKSKSGMAFYLDKSFIS